MNGSLSAGAAFVLPLPFVPVFTPLGPVPVLPNVSVNGQVSAENVSVAFNSGSDRFRLLEAAPQPLFNTAGLIKAAFTFVVEAGIPGVITREVHKTILDEVVLLDLYNGPDANPGNPFVPPGGPVDTKESIVVNLNFPLKEGPALLGAPGNNGVSDVIQIQVRDGSVHVLVNGILAIKPKKQKNVATVKIIGSSDDDLLTVDGRLDRPLEFEGRGGRNSLTVDDRNGGANTRMAYKIAGYAKGNSELVRGTFSTSTGLPLSVLGLTFTDVRDLALSTTSNTQSVQIGVERLTNQELDLILGQTTNAVTVDTTDGGYADLVNITHVKPLPFGPAPRTSVLVRDRNLAEDDQLLYGSGTYEVSRDRLTRRKLLPPQVVSGPIAILSISGTSTVTYDAIDSLSVKGGNLGNIFDVQNTASKTRYSLTGGSGKDTFVVGQVHHNLPGGPGRNRQLGFADATIAIDGGGGLADSLTLDDAGSDFLNYVPRNFYFVNDKFVTLETTVEAEFGPVRTNGTYDYANVENLVIRGGGRSDYFVLDTMTNRELLFEVARTNILGGLNDDTVYVRGTTGTLFIDVGAGTNHVRVGAAGETGTLDFIHGNIGLIGNAPDSINTVRITDGGNAKPSAYYMNADIFFRQGLGTIAYHGMEMNALRIEGGRGGNTFQIDNTPFSKLTGSDVTVAAGAGNDAVTVFATQGPFAVDLQGGTQQRIAVGDDKRSLDGIHGGIRFSGDGQLDATLVDTASKRSHNVSVDSDFFFGQTLEVRDFLDEQSYATRRFLLAFPGQLNLNYRGAQAGDVFFVGAVPANASLALVGGAGGRDVFGIGFGADTNRIQGIVAAFGQAADGDFAYHYDYLNPAPQSYTIQNPIFIDGLLSVARPGAAPVFYSNLAGVSLLAPVVGKNQLNVLGTPAGTQLGIQAGDGDVIALGSGGTVDELLGHVFVSSGNATMLVDDSSNDKTARDVRISSYDFFGSTYGLIEGLTPGGISFVDRPQWAVDIRAGSRDDRFRPGGAPPQTRIAIDGGGGTDALDYSDAAHDVTVNLPLGTATGLSGGIASIENVVGGTGNDLLVGNGGNVLDGGPGRDILIAGSTASALFGGTGEDLLLAGTTDYDFAPIVLDRIRDEWTRTDLDYDTRVANLTTENGSSVPKLTASTVFSNGGGNTLVGGIGDRDLFFARIDLDLADDLPDERLVRI